VVVVVCAGRARLEVGGAAPGAARLGRRGPTRVKGRSRPEKARSVRGVFRALLEEGLDLALEGGFVHHAGMHIGDSAAAIK